MSKPSILDNDLPTIIDHDEGLPAISEEPKGRNAHQDKDIDDDYGVVRTSLQNLNMKGQEALDSALELATETEHPRAYEVVGQLIKTLTDNNKEIMALHRQVKDIKAIDKPSQDTKNTTNNNLVISTTDLQKMLNK